MNTPRYVRHKASGLMHVWHELYNQEDFEPWDDPNVVDVEAKVVPDTVVPIDSKTLKVKKAGLAPPSGDEALSIDASRRLP